jgi:hypothetical protein
MRLSAADPRSSLALALLLLMGIAAGRWTYMADALDIDYFTLWSVPHALTAKPFAHGRTPDIYDADVQRSLGSVLIEEAQAPSASPVQSRATAITSSLYGNRVDATGSPFAYGMTGLLSSGDFARDAWRFQLVSLVCFVGAIVALCRLLRFSAASTVLSVVFFGFAFTPIRGDVRVANVNQIQLALLAAFIVCASREWRAAAGLALGLGVAIKPTLAPVVAALLIFGLADREYGRLARSLVGMFASLLAAAVTAAMYFGRATVWSDFLRSVPRTLDAGYQVANGNYGLAALLPTMTDLPLARILAVGFVAALVVVVMLTRSRTIARPRSSDWTLHESFLVTGTGCALMLLTSQLAWLHYYALLIPIALYLLRPDADVASWSIATCAMALLTETAQHLSSAVGEAVLANAATLLLFGAALRTTWSIRRARVLTADDEHPGPRRARRAEARRGPLSAS